MIVESPLIQRDGSAYVVANDYDMPEHVMEEGKTPIEKRRRSSSTLSDDVHLGDISLDDGNNRVKRKHRKAKTAHKITEVTKIT